MKRQWGNYKRCNLVKDLIAEPSKSKLDNLRTVFLSLQNYCQRSFCREVSILFVVIICGSDWETRRSRQLLPWHVGASSASVALKDTRRDWYGLGGRRQ